jgi:hypothetical protein
METYKIITFEKDADGKNVKVERDATPEEIANFKEQQNKESELINEIFKTYRKI